MLGVQGSALFNPFLLLITDSGDQAPRDIWAEQTSAERLTEFRYESAVRRAYKRLRRICPFGKK